MLIMNLELYSESKYLLIECNLKRSTKLEKRSAQGIIVHSNKRSSYPSHPPQLLFLQSFQQLFVTSVYVLLPNENRKNT